MFIAIEKGQYGKIFKAILFCELSLLLYCSQISVKESNRKFVLVMFLTI